MRSGGERWRTCSRAMDGRRWLRVPIAIVAALAFGAIAASPAFAGNFLATGHDVDDHSQGGGGQEHYMEVATNFVRSGVPDPSKPVLAIECSGLVSGALDGAFGAGVVPRVSNCPSDDEAAFNAIALNTGNFSAIIVGSSCDTINTANCFTSLPDTDLLIARSGDIAAFFNAGGGIFAMSGQGNGDGDASTGPDTYYDFVPLGLTGAEVNEPFCLTAEGLALGFHDQQCPDANFHQGTEDDINCCPTHNSFAEPPAGSALKAAERDSLGFPETLIAQGQISGGGFVNPPPPPPDDPYDEAKEQCFSITIDGAKVQGAEADEKITGTPQSDLLRGGSGKDKINGQAAADCLFGQRGGDKVRGTSGGDIIRGGRGKDELRAGGGDDDVRAQDGNDRVKGGAGDDRIKAQGRGKDRVNCGTGVDKVVGDIKDEISRNCEKVRIVDPN